MEEKTIRLLRADEIECRVAVINERGLSLLLFKDARVDQRILDETFTPFGWRRTHQSIDGNLYCTVEVWDEKKQQWIAKQDVGTMSYSEKEKGQASDSFKRACFNWGVGRELYTAPFIWVPATNANILKKGERYVTTDSFYVRSIAYNDQREITALAIENGKGQRVYELKEKPEKTAGTGTAKAAEEPRAAGTAKEAEKPKKTRTVKAAGTTKAAETAKAVEAAKKAETAGTVETAKTVVTAGANTAEWSKAAEDLQVTEEQIRELYEELRRTGVMLENVLERYQIRDVGELTPEIYRKAMNGLRRTKTREAA